MSKEEIKEALGKMTVLELAELVKELEDEWGVSAAAPVAVAAAPIRSTTITVTVMALFIANPPQKGPMLVSGYVFRRRGLRAVPHLTKKNPPFGKVLLSRQLRL